MNYYGPREIADENGKPTGTWRYTVRNDDRIWAVGYCGEQNCEHATPDEAREHYRQYELDHRTQEVEYTTAHKCEVCGAWTPKGIQVDHGSPFFLCDEHRTMEYVREHYKAGDAISSW